MDSLTDVIVTALCLQWIHRLSEYVAATHPEHKAVLGDIIGERAAELITTSELEDPKTVGFDEVEASRLGVALNQTVSVTPSDNGTCIVSPIESIRSYMVCL